MVAGTAALCDTLYGRHHGKPEYEAVSRCEILGARLLRIEHGSGARCRRTASPSARGCGKAERASRQRGTQASAQAVQGGQARSQARPQARSVGTQGLEAGTPQGAAGFCKAEGRSNSDPRRRACCICGEACSSGQGTTRIQACQSHQACCPAEHGSCHTRPYDNPGASSTPEACDLCGASRAPRQAARAAAACQQARGCGERGGASAEVLALTGAPSACISLADTFCRIREQYSRRALGASRQRRQRRRRIEQRIASVGRLSRQCAAAAAGSA